MPGQRIAARAAYSRGLRHGYYFISTTIEEHLRFHYERLGP